MKIIIVDDDCLVAAALKTILEVNEDVQVAATGVNGKEACQLYEEYQPDVLLMDIRMKEMDGLEASQKILEKFPKANILLLTTFADDEYIVKALRLGAKGYLLKQDYGSILPAIRAVDSGRQYSEPRSLPGFRSFSWENRALIMEAMTSMNGSLRSSG